MHLNDQQTAGSARRTSNGVMKGPAQARPSILNQLTSKVMTAQRQMDDEEIDTGLEPHSDSESDQGQNDEKKPKKLSERKQRHDDIMATFIRENAWKKETKVKGEGNTIRELADDEMSINDLMLRKTDKKIIETPREYQMELFERAKKQNTIAVLDTGSGKTLIAALLIRWMFDEELKHRLNKGRPRIMFFVVGSVALTFQQHGMLSCNLDQSLAQLYGDMNVDSFSQAHWTKIWTQNMGVVCTAEVLAQCLAKGFIKCSDINLLIFDEAHHAKKDHSFSKIMKLYYHNTDKELRPRVFGMTASPVDAKTDVVQAAKDLETLLDARIATTRDTALLRTAVSRPVEQIVYYYPPYSQATNTPLTAKLRACLPDTNFFNELFAKAEIYRLDLGAWCCDRFWELAFREEAGEKVEAVNRRAVKKSGVSKPLQVGNDEFQLIKDARDIVKKHHFVKPTAEDTSLWTDKVDKLRKLFVREFGEDNTSRCIAFVRHRGVGFLLTDLFQHVGPKHLRAAAMVGTRQTEIGEIPYSLSAQIRTLNGFEKGQYNCIFATTVAEEGLDVADCNVIIRFDLYDTMIKYVQSRGRARHQNSRYYHMLEAGKIEHEERLAMVKQSEEVMRSFCQALPEDRLLTGNEDDLNNLTKKQKGWLRCPIEGSDAVLDFHSCLIVLHHYLDVLSQSPGVVHGTILQPTYVMISAAGCFKCEVVLPEPCPIRSVMGKAFSTKAAAKRSAAFFACVELFQARQLDKNLMPNVERAKHVLANAHLAVNEKKKQYEMISKPKFWANTWDTPVDELYLTILNVADPGACGRPHKPVVLLSRKKLPKIPSFPIFPRPNTQTIALCEVLDIPLTPKAFAVDGSDDALAKEKFRLAVTKLTKFTLAVFLDLFNKTYEEDESKVSYWLAPFNADALSKTKADPMSVIDWEVLDSVFGHTHGYTWRTHFLRDTPAGPEDQCFETSELMPKNDDGPRFGGLSHRLEPGRHYYNPNDLVDRFLVDEWDGARRYLVEAVASEYKPTDEPPPNIKHFRAGNSTANAKFKKSIIGYTCSGSPAQRQRVLDTTVLDQPVLKVFALGHKRNLLIPWTEADDKDGSGNVVSKTLAYVCPDSLRISALPASAVALLWNLPAFIFRIEAYLIAQEACERLGITVDVALALEALTKDTLHTEDGKEILDSQHGMGRNYERLEFIGDCFLKMATSISLHTVNATDTEFFSHCNRMEMICNKNLCQHAVESELYKYIRVSALNRRIWYPEGLKLIKGTNANKDTQARVDTASLGDKTIADVCEALIGAALLTYKNTNNMDMAIKAVTATVKNKNHDFTSWPEYYARYVKPEWQTLPADAVQVELAKKCSRKHRYNFKYPRLLYSAFKHSSVPYTFDHMPDYQRLEFLGDGLYDMVCVNFLYERFTDKGPHWLTEHKMPMVSNKFLGFVCVKLGFHRHLRHNSGTIGAQIKRYVQEITDKSRNVSKGPDMWNRMRVQPPKCLPDMVEAYMGAIFVDSEYNFAEVERFFNEHIREHFEDMELYDDFARGHPVTALQCTLQHEYGCQDFSITGKPVPKLPGDSGEERHLSIVLIHDQPAASNFGNSPRYGKSNVANKMRKALEGMEVGEFKMKFKCDCEEKKAAGEKPGLPVDMQIGWDVRC